jgi:hypothetical protein
VIENQDNHGTDYSYQDAVKIQTRHWVRSKDAEEISADDRSDDPENDVENYAFARFVDELAPDESSWNTSTKSASKQVRGIARQVHGKYYRPVRRDQASGILLPGTRRCAATDSNRDEA